MAYNLNIRIITLERIANFCINSTVVKGKQETVHVDGMKKMILNRFWSGVGILDAILFFR